MFPEHGELLREIEGEEKGLEGKENMVQGSHPSCSSTPVMGATSTAEAKHEEYSAWPLPDVAGNIVVEPSKLVQLTMQIDEDEDYDNED